MQKRFHTTYTQELLNTQSENEEWNEMKNKNVKNTDKTSSPVQKQLAFLFSLHRSHDSETQNMALIFLFL